MSDTKTQPPLTFPPHQKREFQCLPITPISHLPPYLMRSGMVEFLKPVAKPSCGQSASADTTCWRRNIFCWRMYIFCWRISLELHIVEKKKVEMSFLDAMVLIYVITFVCKKFDFFFKSAVICVLSQINGTV